MPYDPGQHHRRSIRLANYDYRQAGAYFVTVVAHERRLLFGNAGDEMRLNELGACVTAWWCNLPAHFPHVDLDEFVVMPNHLHGIVVIVDEPQNMAANELDKSCASRQPPTLGQIIAYFKYQSTKQINAARKTPGGLVWQRNYYEHVIRAGTEVERVREYIRNNPLAWPQDVENPLRSNPPL